jgi:hypothetical protein
MFPILMRLWDLAWRFALNPNNTARRQHHTAIRSAATTNPTYFADLTSKLEDTLMEVTLDV